MSLTRALRAITGLPWRSRRLDPALLALLWLLDLSVFWDQRPGGLFEWGTPGYAVLGFLPLLWRRRFPLPVLLIVVAHSLLAWLLFYGYAPTLSVWCALYSAAFYGDRRTATYALLLAFLPSAMSVVDEVRLATPDARDDTLVVSSVFLTLVNLCSFGFGRWAALTLLQRQLEAERAAADAVAAERRRITRDLHDIVAHAVSLMLLQAAGAARILRKDPERAEVALRHVDELGQEAIVELRRMLGLLTDDGDPAAPQHLPGLRNLEALVERTRTDTFRVELATTGDPVPLASGVELSAYRIVQEALTNASRYADHQFPVRVEVNWSPPTLDIRIRNRAPAARRSLSHRLSAGRGVIGMRERAKAVGGSLQAGLQPDASFIVAASFPLVPSETHGLPPVEATPPARPASEPRP
ncbi:sensor histidine kinase [Streptomyces olivaceiscleroticus]|uniref:histidine kinase n=1 Tax=Streptomyces olivaceiscleroticus TaxID=68245 RepID=A0ABP3JWE1_9ACTN